MLTPKIKNNFEIGSGYTDNTGFRSKIIWKKPWINKYGHSLENILSLSILEQFINVKYKIPLFSDPIKQYYLIQGIWINENIYHLQSQITNFNISRYWGDSWCWQSVVNVNWYINHYCIHKNNFSNTIMLICPGIGISRIRKQDEANPFLENSQRYSINISSKYWFSDINFIILQAQNVWIRTFLKKSRILIRSNLSWMKTDSALYVLPSVRCFFIKDHGIRGYKYNFISPFGYLKYEKLITNTIEYQYNLFNKWWGVIFLDAGEITDHIKWKDFKSGIGFGIRWQLPIGPIKLDIAIPLIHKIKMNHKFFCFYINLGPEL